MSYMPTVSKISEESFLYGRDFSPWLDPQEILSTITVTAINQAGIDVTSAMISGASVLTTEGSFTLKAGTSGDEVIITMKVTTSLSNIYDFKIRVLVA